MLILARKVNESVIIGGNITVTVTEIRGEKVRLGFTASREIEIDRKEIYDAKQRERSLSYNTRRQRIIKESDPRQQGADQDTPIQ